MISKEYLALQQKLHQQRPGYGTSAHLHATRIKKKILRMQPQPQSLIDYGCGKQTIRPHMDFIHYRPYDPALPEYSGEPSPADVVLCLDVMEHVEEEYVQAVIQHMKSLCQMLLITTICTRPAGKKLPDGRNAHITLHPIHWWLEQFNPYFDMKFTEKLEDSYWTEFIPRI